MATVFKVVLPKSSVLFCVFGGQKDSVQGIFIKKRFLYRAGSVCRVKQFTTGCFADDEEVETEVRKWLRQQSNDFYVAGFHALVKRWDMCINVCGGYVEK
jgi:hypothetical protein